jgi:hypothetical protein
MKSFILYKDFHLLGVIFVGKLGRYNGLKDFIVIIHKNFPIFQTFFGLKVRTIVLPNILKDFAIFLKILLFF